MPQITFDEVSVSFSEKPILNKVNATIFKGDKIALIGRNGEGKSTLMKVISRLIEPLEGEIKIKNNTVISYLEQNVPADSDKTLFEVVAQGLGEEGEILSSYQNAINHNDYEKLDFYQERIEKLDIWDKFTQVNTMLDKFGINGEVKLKTLSGGWRRRAMLAKSLVLNPDVLLLDEPTNHMDIDAILALEKMLKNMHTTLVLISHDRSFVANIVTKVFDLDRGNLRVFNCGYREYIKRKDEVLHAEGLANARFDKKLAEEEVWIRQGIKARRTRNEGRVRALEAMRGEYQDRRSTKGKIKIHSIDEERRVSKLVFEIKNISYKIAGKTLIQDFSSVIMKGDKVGIIGGNGVGKSTLIKLLLGELESDSGNIRRSKTIKLGYFDQMQQHLDGKMLAKDFVSDGSDRIEIAGQSKHIIGYLRNFLFTGKQALAPIRMLSGGEKNRLMLAKILAKPANLLVLDEPTNDLDVETLELLEEMLRDYTGTLIIISHDREFLNNVVGSTIVMDGKDIIRYTGGYDDYLQAKNQEDNNNKNTLKKNEVVKKNSIKKLNYKEQQELKDVTSKIEKLELEIKFLQEKTLVDNFYQSDDYTNTIKNLTDKEQELDCLFDKWSKLE